MDSEDELYWDLLESCWNQDPDQRLEVSAILEKLNTPVEHRARFEGVQDLTSEIEITDYIPIFVGTFSHLYKGTCRGQAVSLNDLRGVPTLNSYRWQSKCLGQ
jgi:hypothetical protein